MDKPKITAKDFFLWAGAMITFYWSVLATIFLIFDYINYLFPNALSYYPVNPYDSGISYEMASIIVLFPLYLFLMQFIRKDIARDPSRNEIWVRRWALILTLFIAGVAMAMDLVTLLTTFLNGEALTAAFLLKVLTVFLIAGAVFMHFTLDLRGYWQLFPARKRVVSIGVAVLAVVIVVSGFCIVGTPQQARLARFDAQRVMDLQEIQYRVINYYQAKQKLPLTLTELDNPLSYGPISVDPQTGESYVYRSIDDLSFKLCATFNAKSRGTQALRGESMAVPIGIKGGMQDNWHHEAGESCFSRTIDPSFYPPLSR